MALQERFAQGTGEYEEGPELFREDIALSDREPGLGGHLHQRIIGFRNRPEVAIGEQTELVVVVEDDPVVPGDAEVLEQHVAGEDVGGGQLAYGVAIVHNRVPGGLR